MTDVVVILNTVPDSLVGKRIAHILVEEKLAACVNLSQAGLSIYLWENNLEGSEEITLTIKTSKKAQAACQQRLLELHPYEVPEIIVIPVIDGHAPYLNWIQEQTNT